MPKQHICRRRLSSVPFKHTFTEGGLDALQGGNAVHGFMMGLTSSAGGYFIDNNLGSLGKAGEITANSMLSGLVDEIGGGKFANGAITGAFSLILNDWAHHHFSDKVLKKYTMNIYKFPMKTNVG